MGLMDKVKAQAQQLAQMTQDAAQEGKARIDQAQTSRRGDTLLRQLGAAVYAGRTGRGAADTQAQIDKLISDISAYEQANGLNLAAPPPSAPTQSGFPASPPSTFAGPAAAGAPFGDPGTQYPPQSADVGGEGAAPPGASSGPTFVDTTTNFFPAPDDSSPGDPGAESAGPTGLPPEG